MTTGATSFRYSFVTGGLAFLWVVWAQTWTVPNEMMSVVHFGHGTHTNSTAAIRHLKTGGRESPQHNAAIRELFLCCGYGLGRSTCVYGGHTTGTFWCTGPTTRQYRYDTDTGQGFGSGSKEHDRSIRSTSRGNSVAAKKSNPASLIFTTLDPLGNDVTLYTETWNAHIVIGHIEMVGLDALVRQAIEDPYQIRQSTLHPTAYRFEFTDASTTVGVIVTYTGPILSGAETGMVNTAYPIQPAKYTSNVDVVVWDNPKNKKRGGP